MDGRSVRADRPARPAAETALPGLVVADFSRVLAGPFATMVLGDLGAEVVKVERPPGGDETRAWSPPADASGDATYFLSVNRNKRSLVLDLAQEGDLARARELVDRADVVVENFRPGVMDRLGLGYEELSARRPELVYCSITGFGREGGAALPGYDLLLQAVGGLMSVTGDPEGGPQKVGVALVDVLAGLFATVGILAALRHRDATGEGQLVEVDLLSSLLSGLVYQASGYTAGGVVPGRMGNAHPSIAPYEPYATGDGELVVAVGNERQFAAMCATLGDPSLATEPAFTTNEARVANRDALRDRIEAALAAAPAADWVPRLLEAGVPAGQVNDVGQAFALAERLGLDPIVEIPRDGGTSTRVPRNPLRLSRTPASYRSAPPRLDER